VYPGLTLPLLVLLAGALAAMLVVAAARPFLRRLAMRQVSRRPLEAVLVVAGSLLGTAIIVGSLLVGDTLNRSVKDVAYRTLGPVDERVVSADLAQGKAAAARLERLRTDPDVDGLLTLHAEQAAVTRGGGDDRVAEPQALVLAADFGAAEAFGAAGGRDSGLSGATPAAGQAVVNAELADSLGARPGDTITVHLYGRPVPMTVARVVPARGLAGIGFGATVNRDLFVAPGTLTAAAADAGDAAPRTATLVSNRGGVESGDARTDAVEAKIRAALGGLVTAGAQVETPKQEVLANARRSGDELGSLFLFIGSFSIIAGVLLLVNVFVMLTDERRAQLGMLRAMGMRRRRLVGGFLLEGSVYALVAAALGVLLGIGVGWAVVLVAAKIFESYGEAYGNALNLTFAVRPTSLVNGFAAGFAIAFATVALTSARVSRLNIIAAIRDLPDGAGRRPRRWRLVAATALAVLFAVISVPAVAQSWGAMTYLLPALALLCTVPLLLRLARPRAVTTTVSAAVVLWGLLANVARPDVYDDGSTATYIVLGVMLTSGAVMLISANQDVVLRPLHRLTRRPGEAGLAARLALTYPTSRKFRTGATLLMYSLIIFTLVIIAEMGALISAGTETAVVEASAGYAVRVDVNPSTPIADPQRALRGGPLADRVAAVTPLAIAHGSSDDPGRRTTEPLPIAAIGFPADVAEHPLALDERLASLGADDRTVWRTALADPRYVLLDPYFGQTSGPGADAFAPGDTITLTDPASGRTRQKVIAGTVKNALAYYNFPGQQFRFPVFAGEGAVRDLYGSAATTSSMLVRAAPGVSDDDLAAALQGRFLVNGLVATRIEHDVRLAFAANVSFFRLMEGFLALGLVVGITGLGVVMVRAVRERRRTIGVLRALGVRPRTITLAFLGESSFVAVEGILLGTVLSVLTAWLLFTNSPAFGGLQAPFPIAWSTIALTVGATLVASLLATVGPARRAAAIRPAVAVRVAD
jgi:putative ABC transport system permease protein